MLPCILGLSGLSLTADERAFFSEAEPAGFILFGRNVADKGQLRALTDDLRALTGRADLPILIDQEGGRISRLRPPEWPAFPAQSSFAALYQRAPFSAMEAARVNAQAIGLTLSEVGINVACLPVLDLGHPDGHSVIGDRALGSEPMQVAALGRSILDGLQAGGVTGVIKHMPGHGRAQADSHAELPVVTAPAAELEQDLAPFRRLAGRARIGMTAHILYKEWDPGRPATLSSTIIGEIIRTGIGFEGLLITDDVAMAALSGSIAERGAAALAAGCDLVLHCSGKLGEAEQLAASLPSMGEAARERLAGAVPPPAQDGEIEQLLAKRDALLALA
jgi:beta-N-acetylhexosaminidase